MRFTQTDDTIFYPAVLLIKHSVQDTLLPVYLRSNQKLLVVLSRKNRQRYIPRKTIYRPQIASQKTKLLPYASPYMRFGRMTPTDRLQILLPGLFPVGPRLATFLISRCPQLIYDPFHMISRII